MSPDALTLGGELTEEAIARARAELRETDEEPLESPWHRAEINLLIDQIKQHRKGRTDYYVGGNIFIYYSRRQARAWEYRGPDFFLVNNVDGTRERLYWWVFEEDRFPDVIIELMSSSTAQVDLTTKKQLYQDKFRTREYFAYDPEAQQLLGWRLDEMGRYQAIPPDKDGRLWSEDAGLGLDKWEGSYLQMQAVWLRWFERDGRVVPTEAEFSQIQAEKEKRLAEAERERAEAEKQRADQLAQEVARLKAMLEAKSEPRGS
jgi:Uma2 family endonuclease